MDEIMWHRRESRRKQRKQTSSCSHGRLLSTRTVPPAKQKTNPLCVLGASVVKNLFWTRVCFPPLISDSIDIDITYFFWSPVGPVSGGSVRPSGGSLLWITHELVSFGESVDKILSNFPKAQPRASRMTIRMLK